MCARVAGHRIAFGRPEWVQGVLELPSLPEGLTDGANGDATLVALAKEGEWIAVLVLRDALRTEAQAVAERLATAGVRLHILSGDRPDAVRAVAEKLGVADARGGLLPEAKHAQLVALREQGAVVGMVGDGVNDAPVLAAADVGIAMGGGADLTRLHADVVLASESLWGVWWLYRQSQRTLRIIQQNLRWSFAYNLLAIPLAMAGWVTPWLAGIGMAASSLVVVANALRLQRLPE